MWISKGVRYGDEQLVRVARRRIFERIRRLVGRGKFFSRRRIDVLRKILAWLPTKYAGRSSRRFHRLDEVVESPKGHYRSLPLR